ncbi:MAG: bifunctional 5,10-methylenetetrahydrofolate dehydrogenase/5,10-methenyltetrahydrofolate cyclohydrolase [Armatimonadota bacterium]
MPANILEGKPLADRIRAELADEIAQMDAPPRLVALMVGEDAGARAYAKMQARACEQVGMMYELRELDPGLTQAELLAAIAAANDDPAVNGIILQLPLPEGLDGAAAQGAIDPTKDVDGVHPYNLGLVVQEQPALVPCTAQAVVALIEESGAQLRGAEVVVVGRSVIVGKPAALMLLDRGATVTICRSTTRDLAVHTARAEVLVVAIGRAKMIRGDQIRPGAVVIDVGMNWMDGGYVGDVAFDEAVQVAGVITPVPGGVGPVTVTMLLRNTVEAAKRQRA